MEKPQSHLTANPTSADAGSLLDVNEKLHALSLRLKEKRPEDVAKALSLVNQYSEMMIKNESQVDLQFQKLQDMFPDAKFERISVFIDNKSVGELLNEMSDAGIDVTSTSKGILYKHNSKFGKPRTVELVKFRLKDLALGVVNTFELYARTYALGLSVCPMEAVPFLRLNYLKQTQGERLYVGMTPIPALEQSEDIFLVYNVSGLGLAFWPALQQSEWEEECQFVFCLD